MRATVLSLGAWLALAGVARAADESKLELPRTVSTSGEAVINAPPDEVNVNFSIEIVLPDLDKARELSEQTGARLLKAIKALGVEAKHIQTDHLDVEIRYRDHNSLVIAGYVVRRGYAVTLKDIQKFEPLVETALKNGANRLLGFEYRTSELRKFRDQARQMAIRAAQEKPKALAEALNCQVGAPRTIQEGGGFYGYWGGRGLGANAMAQNVAQSAVPVGGGDGEGGQATSLGQIGVRAQVSVTFDLCPSANKFSLATG